MNNGKSADALFWHKLPWKVHYESDAENHYLCFTVKVPQSGENEHGGWSCTSLAYTGNVRPGSVAGDLLEDLKACLKAGEPHAE